MAKKAYSDISNYFDDKVLVIFDTDSMAKDFYVSEGMSKIMKKPYFSFNYKYKQINSTIIYGILNKLVNTMYYLDNVDILFSFTTWGNTDLTLTKEQALNLDNPFMRQLLSLRASIKEFKGNVLEKRGLDSFEIIRNIVPLIEKNYDKVFIVSSDLTLFDLISDKITMIDGVQFYNSDSYFQKFKIKVDYNLIRLAVLGYPKLKLEKVKGLGNAKFLKLISELEKSEYITLEDKLLNCSLSDALKNEILGKMKWLQSNKKYDKIIYPHQIDKQLLRNNLEFYHCKSLIEKVE